ncbi:type IV secretory system conjugative DNA transfer family protein [Sporosarcina sp. Marseille-Q4063]|uniref:type IV secretory system conjugative DNA transfer family protein n=1 Tax=Sporosarcina sp. Marseille-Q4063 TaxID=2810514 RepID=UPI0020162460|nr:type IV secretory system conjugative DNA transfer family protein [Sporosarcina sp. Marseille-Q4063]
MGMPIVWQGSDCFTHMLAVGPTRCGKTATILKPMIYQLLLQKKRGIPLGISVVEPKGDVAAMVNEMCLEMDIPCTHVDPDKPDSARFNPMEGDTDTVAEATVVVLKGLFGKQDAFFATVQELSARNVTKLLKELHGNNMDIVDVMNTLRDQNVLEQKVTELKRRDGMTDLVHFFEAELLGSMREKYQQFVIGLRAQLENIVSNEALRTIMTGQSDVNIDEHLETGGVLAVNTALGKLRKAGDAFGQFMIMHLQNGTFRRPGTEDTRIPHFLIVDEYSRYINPDVEIFLSLAAEYRVAGIFATQSLGQLEIESGSLGPKAMKQAILTSCRNKICFGGISAQDAKEFAEEFGMDKVIMRQSTYKNRILLPRLFPDSYRDTEDEEYRFDFTDLMDGIPKFNFVHKLLQDGTPQKPALAKGQFVPRNWKELREWEDGTSFKKLKKSSLLKRFQKRKKKEQAAGLEQSEQMEAESLTESIIQPEIESLYSFGANPDIKESNVSLPTESKQEVEMKHILEHKKETKERMKSIVEQSKAKDVQSPDTKIKPKKTNNVVKSNDGFWD